MSESRERTLRAIQVKDAHEAELLGKANVLGVGVGMRQRGGQTTDDVAVVVLVTRKIPVVELAAGDVIPAEIEGVPVDVLEVGDVRAGAQGGGR